MSNVYRWLLQYRDAYKSVLQSLPSYRCSHGPRLPQISPLLLRIFCKLSSKHDHLCMDLHHRSPIHSNHGLEQVIPFALQISFRKRDTTRLLQDCPQYRILQSPEEDNDRGPLPGSLHSWCNHNDCRCRIPSSPSQCMSPLFPHGGPDRGPEQVALQPWYPYISCL